MYHGDIRLESTIHIKFYLGDLGSTVGAGVNVGLPTALLGTPVVSAYPANSTTQLTAGITLTASFDSVTALNNVTVAATAANGYAAGTDYALVLTAGTVDSLSVVGMVIGSFSIENRSAVMPTTAGRTLDVSAGGEAGVDWANVGSPTTTVGLSNTTVGIVTDLADNAINAATLATDTITAAKIADGAIDAATFAAGAINAAAIATDAITAAKIAADAIGASELAADAVAEIQSGLATAAALDTVDNFLDTEIAAILEDTGTTLNDLLVAIKAKTDLIPGTTDGKTFAQLVTLFAAVLLGKASGLATTTAVYRAADDSKDRVTATVDSDGNRSAVTLDAS